MLNGMTLGLSTSSRSENNTIIKNAIYKNSYNGINGFVNCNNIAKNAIYNNSREGINITGNYNNILVEKSIITHLMECYW